jgi:putative peptidoglycan lipid II flippase
MRRPSLASSSLIIAGSYVVSNIAGFLARALMNARFGSGLETDAFWLAFRFPDLLFNLFASGALGSAFIPVFAGMLDRVHYTRAWRLTQRIASIVFGVVTLLAVLAAWRAEWLIGAFIAPQAAPELQALSASLMRLMLISTVIFSISGLLMGVLQSAGSFLAPALAPMLYKLGHVLGVLLLSERFGIYGAAIGVVFGALLHLLVQIPALIRVYREKPPVSIEATPNLRTDIRDVLGAMPWRMLGSGAVYLNNIVQSALVSGTRAAVNSLDTAFATLILPQAVIAQAISTALFPTISRHAARGERAEFGRTLAQALRIIIALSAPAAIGLIALGQPIIALLFQRGRFDPLASEQAGLALALYATGLVAHCVLELVTRAFYALKDNKPPVAAGVASVALNIVLTIALLPVLARMTPYAFVAVALANAIATTLETLLLYWMLLRRVPELGVRLAIVALGKSLLAALLMAVALLVWQQAVAPGIVSTLGALLLGALVYALAAWLLKSEELAWLLRRVRVLE